MNKIKAWLDAHLVPEWRSAWKLWSMRLGAVAAAIVTYLAAVPDALNGALNALPHDIRDSLPAWIGPAMLGVLFLARFWDQSKGRNDG